MQSKTVTLCASAFWAASTVSGMSAAPADVKPLLDPIVATAMASGQCPGVAIGVDRNGKTSEAFYGASGTKRPFDGKTVFEIDSLTKTFTALAFALATQGPNPSMALDDPLQKYAPPGVKLPTYNGTPITLVELATHTAGLPRVEIGDTDKSPSQTWAYTAKLKLATKPGTTYLYSNLGFGLLGLAEERAEGKGLEQLFEEQIAGPLDMPDTRITISNDELARKAQGHRPNRTKAPFDDRKGKGGLFGAYALDSTIDDMLKYLALQMGLAGSDALKQAAQLTQQPVHPNGPLSQTGLAWNVTRLKDGTPVISKDGTGPGFTTFVAFAPSTNNGVVVIANQLSCPVSKISYTALSGLNHLKE